MATDVRRHTAPAAGETPRRQAFNDLSLSINDAVPVANTTERAQLVSDLTAISQAPSTSRPLLVYRADAARYEFTTVPVPSDADWRVLPSLKAAALPHIRMRKTVVQARGAGNWSQISFEATSDAAGDQPWTVPGDGTITVTQPGLYMFDLTASMTIAGFACQIRKAGSNDVLDQSPLGTSTSQSNHAHATRRLAAGDLVIGLVYPSAAANLTVDNPATPTFMTVTKLSD